MSLGNHDSFCGYSIEIGPTTNSHTAVLSNHTDESLADIADIVVFVQELDMLLHSLGGGEMSGLLARVQITSMIRTGYNHNYHHDRATVTVTE
jgi:hypothetical protein